MQDILSRLRSETENALRVLHALIQFSSFLDDYKTLNKVNENPYFWKVFADSVTTKLFISIRRLFDDGGNKFRWVSVVDECINRIQEFQPAALEKRKMQGGLLKPDWLDEYMSKVYEPTEDDFIKLKELVWKNSSKMRGDYKTAASEIYAHAIHIDPFVINDRLSKLNFEEIETSLNSIWHFYTQVSNLYDNGIKPSLDILPYPYVAEVRNSVIKQLGN